MTHTQAFKRDYYKWATQEIENIMSCDRNLCLQNEYNGIGCDECVVYKEREKDCLK